jgi:predicted nucleic acid-binding protein
MFVKKPGTKNMLRAYLDTNIYYISRINSETNSRILINAAISEKFKVIQSDYLYDEIKTLFRRKFTKDIAAFQRYFMLSIPLKTIVSESQWSPLVKKFRPYIEDVDDIPHICSYIYAECDYFVTNNRRLTQMEIKDVVNFLTPTEFVDLLNLKSFDTIRGV